MTWLPFDLHPEYPREGIPRAQLHARYGEPFHDRLRSMFEAAGLAYNPPPDVVPNSKDALRLAELGRDLDRHDEVHDRLMNAYWNEARNIGNVDELRALAAELDLPENDVERVLSGDEHARRVDASTAQAAAIGVTGVPGFLLDERLLVLGAQPRHVFEHAFEQLAAA